MVRGPHSAMFWNVFHQGLLAVVYIHDLENFPACIYPACLAVCVCAGRLYTICLPPEYMESTCAAFIAEQLDFVFPAKSNKYSIWF